jgi:uncharacterized spore protein YtfJ
MAVLQDILSVPRDVLNARRVYGDPIEKGEVTLIPAAHVAGGGGGGAGPAEEEDGGEAAGGGFAGMARPVGMYVVRGDRVDWKPALDVTMIAVAGIALAALMTLTLGSVLRHWMRTA